MARKAVHIYLSTFENESRILKETKSLMTYGIVDEVIVLAKGKEGLLEFEEFDKNRFVYRVRPRFMRDKKLIPGLRFFILFIKLIDIIFKYLSIIRKEKPVYVNIHQVLMLPLIPLVKLVAPNTKFIYDTHELETESNGLQGKRQKLFKLFERLFIKSFKLVIVVGPAIEDWYRKEYGIDNIVTVMNCPLYQQFEKKNLFREEFGIPDHATIFLYQGALFFGRGVDVMLDAFAQINDEKYTLVLMGYGEMVDHIKTVADQYPNIHFKQAVHPSIVLNYTASADVGISLIENVCLSYYYCLPNKLFEYLMAGIPCIVSNMKEMSDYVRKNGAGVVCEDTTKEALINAVKSIDQFDRFSFHQHIEQVMKQYCWENQERIMIDAYKKLEVL